MMSRLDAWPDSPQRVPACRIADKPADTCRCAGAAAPTCARMIDAAIKALADMFTPAVRAVLLKSDRAGADH